MRPTYKQRDCCLAISRFRFETLAIAAAAFLVLVPQAGAQTTVPDIPTVEGPITGPGGSGLCSQTGYITPLSDEELNALYRSKGDYLAQVVRRLLHLVFEG